MAEAIDVLADFDPFATSPAPASTPGARRYVLLDVFTAEPLSGNQLAVFTDARGLSSQLMVRMARELNLSETVFVLPPERGGDIRLRIFTPGGELPFAGHPVLGAAVVVGAALGRSTLTLETAAAPVPVRVERVDARVTSARMQQPIPSWRPFERAQELLAALRVERSQLPVDVYDNGPRHVYVALESEQAVAALRPDLHALSELGELGTSCFAGAGGRWKTRMFFPTLGVPEDPATGSAAGPLAVHLSRHRRIGFGQEIEIEQGTEIGRRSLLLACARGCAERIERVEVGGSAVMLGRGELFLGV
jgi:trans-2,3-dihydro-3-hydroxyanthranilate isomerase